MDSAATKKTPASDSTPAEATSTEASASILDSLRARLDALVGPEARMRKRFVAWWEGYDLPDEPAAEEKAAETPSAASAPGSAEAKPSIADRWSPGRVKVSEMIWSDGFSFPGGDDHILKLVQPMGLNKEKTFLDLGAGLGGAARAIAKTFGAWVVGLEASKTLAEAGMAASEKAGLGKKAPIEIFDPTTVILPARKYDAIFSRLVLLLVQDKKRLIGQIHQALKSEGQLMFLEFTLSKKGANSPALSAWIAGEDHPPLPVTIADYSAELKALKMDIRVAEDMTAGFRGLVLQGWAKLARELKANTLGDEDAKALIHEVELWSRRVAAFDAGDLQVARFYALKRG